VVVEILEIGFNFLIIALIWAIRIACVAELVEILTLIRKSLDAVDVFGTIGLEFVNVTFVCDIIIGGIRGRSRIGMRLLESQKFNET
jgi:hypothetical protein